MTTQRLASFSLFSILSTSLLLGCVLLGCVLLGCGGGGGGSGDNFIGAAEVRIQTSPERIDSGDRTEVRITLSNLHPNGIALKIRYPKGLDYVNASSFITINDSDTDVSPTINQTKGSDVYLVYYISTDQIGENEEGTLYFELEGKDSIEDGEIEVDPDVDDPAIDNATEFNTDEPQFGAEDQVSIQVTD